MRRTWMLLLVTVLLTVFLAVPAMAADCCGGANHCATCDADHTGWTPISEAEFTIHAKGYYELTTGGKYYIDDAACDANGVYTKGILISNAITDTITICLNGKTWAGDSATTSAVEGVTNKVINRPLTINAKCTINIVDCSAVTDGVSAGKIQGVSHSDNAGTIFVNNTNAKLNIYAGTIQGGTVTGKNGGAIRNTGILSIYGGVISGGKAVGTSTADTGIGGNIFNRGTLNIHGGTITGGEVTKSTGARTGYGGNIYSTEGEVNMYGGLITNGEAFYGGNVYVTNAASKFNLYAGTISNGRATGAAACRVGNVLMDNGVMTMGVKGKAETDALNESVKIIDGEAFVDENTRKDVNCGNLWISSNATLNMYYGTISGGKAANSVGNIRLDGVMNMYGGIVRDGKITMNASGMLATPSNHNIFVYNTKARLNMSGGHIYGYSSTSGVTAGSIKFSGSAKFYAPDSDGDGLPDDGIKPSVAPVLDKLDNDAKLAIQMSDGSTITYDAENSTISAADWMGYINHQIVGYGNDWWTVQKVDGAATIVKKTESGTNRWHCLCGANAGETHIGDCEGYDICWEQKLLSANGALPNPSSNEAKYYYLVDNDGTADNIVTWTTQKSIGAIDGTNADTYTRNVFIDFNGVTLRMTDANRMLYIASDGGAQHVTFTDSSRGHTGGFDSDSAKADHSRILWLRKYSSKGRDAAFDHIVNIYRITMDASGTSSATKGGVAMLDTGTASLYDAHLIGASVSTNGGAVMISSGATLKLVSGTISGGAATNGGGNIYVSGNLEIGKAGVTETDKLNKSAVISGGWASGKDKHAGNIYVGSTGTVNMYYGSIVDGKAAGQAGNVRIDKTFNMYGGVISGGRNSVTTATAAGSATANNANGWLVGANAELNISGGRIHGYTYSYTSGSSIPAVKVSGSAKIYSDNGHGLILGNAAKVTVENLSADAKIGITCTDIAAGRVLSNAITDTSSVVGLYSTMSGYKIAWNADGTLSMETPDSMTTGVMLNGNVQMTLAQAVTMAGGNDFVRLLSAHDGKLTINKNVNLDLAGNTVGEIEVTGGTLKLVDSANGNYTDAGKRVKITIGENGNVERAFITGTMNAYGANHRYLVLKHADGTYSSHRIYLAVQNPVLYPMKAAMSFKTVLGCDATVAGYVKEYGVIATGDSGSDEANYLEKDGVQILPYEGVNQNAMTAAVVNILNGTDDENRSVADLQGQAYMLLDDYFYGTDANQRVTSAKKGANLKALVQAADSMTLSNPQKVAVAQMYTKYSTLMSGWNLDNISSYAANIGLVERHCLCGDTSSKNNACAASGHRQLDWQPLPTDFKGGTLASGNYYLTEENLTDGVFKQTGLITVSEGSMVCLDTKGFDITSPSRLANVFGVFNLTNSQKATKESFISMSCNADGNGGLLILGTGNVSLYKGVTLQGAENHKIKEGLVQANGSLNVYGANIIGTTLAEGKNAPGGAVYVGANGYFFINDGTIEAGDNNDRGGAIYTVGRTYIQGNAKLVAGTGTRTGGLLFVAGGEVNVGVSLTGAETQLGAVATVTGGTLNLNGSVTMDGENATYSTVITGATAQRGGAIFVAGGVVNVTGAKIVGGVTNAYETTTGEGESAVTTQNLGMGGAIFMEGGEVHLTSNAMIDGGTASLGGAVYVEKGSFTMDSSIVQNGHATRTSKTSTDGCGSNFYVQAGTLKITNNSVVQGGTSNYYDADGYGGSVLYAKGGEVNVEDSKLYGVLSQNWKRGGTIFNNGGTITIENTNVTACKVANNSSVLLNVAGTFTMKGNSKLDASGVTSKLAYGGAVVNNATFNMENGQIIGCKTGYDNHGGGAVHTSGTFTMENGSITGGSTVDTATSHYTNLGGNVRVSGGTFTMKGGSITGGSTSGSKSQGGGNVAITDGTFNMEGGVISGGTASTNGGNVYVKTGTFTMNGGTVSNQELQEETETDYLYGKYHAQGGGNIYVDNGAFEMKGGTVTGGIARNGGNLYVKNTARAELSGGTIQNGRVVANGWDSTNNRPNTNGHGGNLYNNGATTISGTELRDGKATHTAGNVYSNGGTLTMTGGLITGGKENNHNNGKWIANSATNLMIVTSNLTVTGGTVDGGITVNNYEKDYVTHPDEIYLRVGGTAKLLATNGYGMSLTSGVKTKATETTPAVNFLPPRFEIEWAKTLVTEGEDKAEIHIQALNNGELLVARGEMTEDQWLALESVAELVFVNRQSGKQVTFEEDGIYLRAVAAGTRYACTCGQNPGEEHLGECAHYDVLYNEYKLGGKGGNTTLPNPSTSEPAYYYLVDNDGTADNTYALQKQNVIGTSNNADIETIGDKVEGGRKVYIDFNGVTVTSGQAFNEANQPRLLYVVSDRTAQKVTLLDSSKDHSGGLVTGDIQREDHANAFWVRNAYDDELQSHDVQMYRIRVDGSTCQHSTGATGIRVDVGTLKMYDVTLTGGTIVKKSAHGAAMIIGEKGAVQMIGGTVNGGVATGRGGAIYVLGTLSMKDVTVTGGEAQIGGNIFVNTKAKLDMENCKIEKGKATLSGGGNIFIYGGDVTMKGGSITGGEAWVENGAERNDLTERKPAVGGGVYLASGDFEVSGNVTIKDNYAYGYSIDTKTSNVFDDIYVSDKSDKFASNLYLNGNAVKDAGLTSGSEICFSMLEGEDTGVKYQGVFALSESNSSGYFKPDNANATSGKTLGYGDGKLYYGVGSANTYLVGYGAASIQPTKKDLVTGMAMTGYGNTAWRNTNKTYTNANTDENGLRTDLGVTDYKNFSGLKATALAITDGQGETVIIMSTDAISSANNDLARKLISQATGVPVDNITISACHQHSTPECKTVYYVYQDAEGNPILNEKGETQYADANNNLLPEGADPVIKTDYRRTYLAGVVQAAVTAYNDRAQASMTAGILDTASGTYQYNFVRNVTIKVKEDYLHYYQGNKNQPIQYLKGEGYNRTDGHSGIPTDLFTEIKKAYAGKTVSDGYDANELKRCFEFYYESEVDTTMQLVQFTRQGKKPIVLANFQTHPHHAGGSENQNVHSDVVGTFRYYLETNYVADVLYFSGAGGNVNTNPKLNDSSKSVVSGMGNTTDEQKMERARVYGQSLAGLAEAFLEGNGNMTEVTNARDVNVSKTAVAYEYQPFDASEEAVQNIIDNQILDWENGGYINDPTGFDNYWYELCGKYSYAVYGDAAESHRVYHAYDASGLRAKYQRMLKGETGSEITIMAYNLGGIGFVQAPYEMFQESGQAIKGNVKGSKYVSTADNPFGITIIASQANTSEGYIPTEIAYENGGGYSSTDNCKYAEGTAEVLVERYVELLNGMYK